MYKRNLDVSIFPVSDNVDLSCYDKISDDFFNWIKDRAQNRYSGIDKNTKCIQLWHLRGSDSCPTSQSYLYTFHEINGTTPIERSICGLHEKTIFSSNFSRDNFSLDIKTKELGIPDPHVESCPLGFDEDIIKLDKKYFDDCVHFILIGKWESRKNTEQIIRNWLSLFGNKKGYRLTCLVDNPFFKREIMDTLIAKVLNKKDYFNITFLPHLKTNSEMTDLYNSADIDLSGLSSAEGWNLPSFNSTCLGKWSCVMNHTSHKDWATSDNSILVEPTGIREPYDGAFFKKGDEYNQGTIFDLSDEVLRQTILKSVDFAKKPNPNGENLRQIFTYDRTLEILLSHCGIT